MCSSEQSIIVEECNRDRVIEELKKQGCYFMNPEESKKVSQVLFSDGSSIIDAGMVGKKPEFIASVAGIEIPNDTKILIGEGEGVGPEYPLSYEKLTPVLAFYTVRDWLEAWKLSKKLLQNGLGHTMVIHTENENMVMEFSKMPISRIVVNTGGAQGGTGASTGLMPSFTLGCGTWGGSSVSENVGPMNLINIKKIAYGIEKSAAESLDASVNNIEAGNSKSLYNNEDYLQNSPSSYASRVRQSTLSTKEAESNCTNENQGLIKIMEGLIAELGRDK